MLLSDQKMPYKVDKKPGRHSDTPVSITALDTVNWTTIEFDKKDWPSYMIGEVAEWIQLNIEPGNVYVGLQSIKFKYEQDAVLFTLRFA